MKKYNLGNQNKILKIMSNGELFQFSDLMKHGISRRALNALVIQGLVDNSQRGFYKSIDDKTLQKVEDSNFTLEMYAPIFKKLNNQGVLCLYSAANFYGLIDVIEHQTFVAYPWEKGKLNLSSDLMEVRGVRWKNKDFFEVGVSKIGQSGGVNILATSPERTIIDLFRYSQFVVGDKKRGFVSDNETVVEALKNAKTLGIYNHQEAIKLSDFFGIRKEFVLFNQNTNSYKIDDPGFSMR